MQGRVIPKAPRPLTPCDPPEEFNPPVHVADPDEFEDPPGEEGVELPKDEHGNEAEEDKLLDDQAGETAGPHEPDDAHRDY